MVAARSVLVLASLVLVGASACSDGTSQDEGDKATSTTASSSTETSAEHTEATEPDVMVSPQTTATSTTSMVTPTLPPELEAKYPVELAEGVTGLDTQDIAVWSPDAEGSWPIVLILHGLGSQGMHYAETASLLASQGVVVFAPDYRSTLIPTPEWKSAYRDSECAYRHVRTIASDYGGDIDQPITIVGHSIGASVGMSMVLDEINFGPSGNFDACPGDVPRPDQLVALSGCYYKNHVGETFPFDPAGFGWTHQDAHIELVVGSEDDVCEAWQSEDAETELVADGYDNVDLTTINDADHFSVIFTGYDNGPWYGPDVEWFSLLNDPGGVATVQTILDTINTPAN